ncbi:putative TetR family transcriptional regulator [Gordonia araii NBRC 100433]|uniref:Putative TetR family transcriptional regulator n=1 Tax=Gordonia araii NBRC 100433 TaxID=1073574 RepID=G7H5T8_9ACTN|nr:TetR family transcriptional regulator [Gordonia araii]NNG95711.1 TetR family transcriptional regulator [Gordonia araii NBRC 100433]GAB11213.1 putative TetR family transcriptional regulator [Gordonia araii NBRC 100433]
MPRLVDHAQRRALIDDTVVAIAAESGFDAVTIRAVAQRIGASTSAVTHYVTSRDELLRNAIRREIDLRLAEADTAIGASSGVDGLHALLDWVMTGRNHNGHRFWLAAILSASSQPVVAAELTRFNDWWTARVRTLLADTPVDDVEAASDLIGVLVDGLVINGFYEDAPATAQRRARVLDLAWNALGL